MARVSLSSVVNTRFLSSLAQAGGLGSSDSAIKLNTSSSGQSSTSTNVSSALQVGTQAYARAVHGLNSLVSALNISEGALEDLLEIAERALVIVDRATKVNLNSAAREQLNDDFQKLGEEFRDVIKKAKLGDFELIDVKDLAQLFSGLGLNPEQSDAMAEVFNEFLLTKDRSYPEKDRSYDYHLASANIKGTRPHPTPPTSFGVIQVGNNLGALEQISDATAQAGAIASGYSIYQADDGGGNQTVFIENHVADSSSSLSVTSDATLKAVEEHSGFSVIESSEDFLTYNASNNSQLFLVDNQGNVVHQFTNNDGTATYGNIDVSSDLLTIAFAETAAGVDSLITVAAGSLGEDPSTSSRTAVQTLGVGAAVGAVKISDDGNTAAFMEENGADSTIHWHNLLLSTKDTTLALNSAEVDFGFLDSGRLLILRQDGGSQDIIEREYSGTETTLLNDASVGAFTSLERGTSNSGYFAIEDTALNDVLLYNEEGTLVDRSDLSTAEGDAVTTLSLARNAGGGAEIAVYGVIESLNADSDNELYRLSSKNAGEGSFGNTATLSGTASSRADEVVTGDFNADGNLDIAAPLDGTSTDLGIFLGNGDGSFQGVSTVSTTMSTIYSIDVADFNGDGILDLIMGNQTDVDVFEGQGDGTFDNTVPTTSDPANSVRAGDLNNDGMDDFIALSNSSHHFRPRIRQSDGTWTTPGTYNVGLNPQDLELADIDGDGRLDVVTADYNDDTLSVLLGNGDGTFAVRTTEVTASSPTAVELADVNGDGNIDLISGGTSDLSVHLGNGDGTFAAKVDYAVADSLQDISLGDFNGDGVLDIFSLHDDAGNSTGRLLIGDGDGTFQSATTVSVSYSAPKGSTVGDVDNDGAIDLIVSGGSGNPVATLLGESDGRPREAGSGDGGGVSSGYWLSQPLNEFASVFSEERSIALRADAFRVFNDLEALIDQIKTNISAVQGATESVRGNLTLASSTAMAFNDVREKITSEKSASMVVNELRQRIRRAPHEAQSQLENLQSIAVAALNLDSRLS